MRTQTLEDIKEGRREAISDPPGDRKFVTALARGLEVLRAFKVRDGFLGNAEISDRTGLPRPTVSRLTHTLCKLGYLVQMPRTGKYQLAPTAITLGYSALANLGIRNVARPFMEELAEELSAPIALGTRDRVRALYVDISRGSSAFTVQLEVGARLPLAKSAMGWALLAATPDDEFGSVMQQLRERHGTEWSKLEPLIQQALADLPAKGYVSTAGVWRSDIHAVGVPLVMDDGSGIFAFNCGGPPHQFTSEAIRTVYGPALVDMVGQVERVLNGVAN